MSARPFVQVNMAVTADGKVDTVARTGARISGPADTARVDALRAATDAILVGGHTLLAEDPRLTVRDPALIDGRRARGRHPQPMKVGLATGIGALGTRGSLPTASRFLSDGGGRPCIFTTHATEPDVVEALEAAGADVEVHAGPRVDLPLALEQLVSKGVEHLMVEGGGTIVAALLAAGLVDEISLAIAPRIFGGESAPTPVGGSGFGVDAVRLSLADVSTTADGDVITRYDVVAP